MPQTKGTRLSVNINLETAAALRSMFSDRGVTVTEGIRRAVAVYKVLLDAQEDGATVQIVKGKGRKAEVTTVSFLL